MKTREEYLLSIVIPTRNREYYANAAIRQVLSVSSDDVQVVVQDNSDNDQLEKLLVDILDKENVVYNHTRTVLSFVDNFDQALQLASGKYITMIGDDDGITKGLYEATKWADKNGYKAIKPNLNIVYFWPGSKVFDTEDNGVLKIVSSFGKAKMSSSLFELKKLLNNSCQDYLDMDLVKIYHGIVQRDVLDAIKEKTGRYVGGLSPDIYLSTALSAILNDNIVVLDMPLTISGICNASGSSASATGAHTGKIEDAPHFIGHDTYEWSKKVPKFYSVETIWADSALAAVQDICPELEKDFRPDRMVEICLSKYPQYKYIVANTYSGIERINIGHVANQFARNCSRIKRGIWNRLHKRSRREWKAVDDIIKASEIIEQELQSQYSSIFQSTNA